MLVASDDATAGSVIAKQERISPSISGLSQRSFCSLLPYRAIVSMLPVSGAEQLKGSAPIGERPMISHSGAYSSLLSPSGTSSLGRNRFHRPCDFALALSSSMMGGTLHRLGNLESSRRYTSSAGRDVFSNK